MPRNPFTRLRQETVRIAQRATLTPAAQSLTASSSAGVLSVGIVDPATGALLPYGQLDFTPLDEGDGFVLR